MNIETFIRDLLLMPATLGEIVFACENAGYKVVGDKEIVLPGDRVLWAASATISPRPSKHFSSPRASRSKKSTCLNSFRSAR